MLEFFYAKEDEVYMELTLICIGEESKVNSLRDLVAFQHE